MALIEIEDMEFYAYHGCFKAENIVGTRFKVNLKIELDTTAAEQSDKLTDTLNYQTAYLIVKEQMLQTSHLLEHVARRIIDSLKTSFPEIKQVEVKVSKMNPPLGGQIQAVSVTLNNEPLKNND